MKNFYISAGEVRFGVDDDEGARRLRDALSRLLQVHNLSFLIGSGASFHLGGPIIRSVTADDLVNMCLSANVDLEKGQVDLLSRLVGNGVDLEAFLSQLSVSLQYGDVSLQYGDIVSRRKIDIGGVECGMSDVRRLLSAVNVALASACDLPRSVHHLQPPYDTDPWTAHRELFRRVLAARRPDAPRVRVFTTNYDTVIEASLDDGVIHYLDGFVGTIRRRFSLASYDNDLYSIPQTGDRTLRRLPELLHLYKIHGSLSWRQEAPSSPLRSIGLVQVYGPPGPDEMAVIFPTPTKEKDVLGYPYSDLLRIFGNSISKPESALLVSGYGFADDHINRLIFEALNHNPTLQLFVADPFGILDATDDGDEPHFVDSPAGRLAAVQDARISLFTGEAAKFTSLPDFLPDVAEKSPEERQRGQTALVDALLARLTPTLRVSAEAEENENETG